MHAHTDAHEVNGLSLGNIFFVEIKRDSLRSIGELLTFII